MVLLGGLCGWDGCLGGVVCGLLLCPGAGCRRGAGGGKSCLRLCLLFGAWQWGGRSGADNVLPRADDHCAGMSPSGVGA